MKIKNFGQTGSVCNLGTYNLYEYIICQTKLKGGCSINEKRQQPSTGYMVGVLGFGDNLMEMLNYELEDGEYYGSWINPETNQMEFDISVNVQDLNLAISIAKEHNQISIYDLNNENEVKLNE